jgi:hypothetical protein
MSDKLPARDQRKAVSKAVAKLSVEIKIYVPPSRGQKIRGKGRAGISMTPFLRKQHADSTREHVRQVG